MHQSGHLGGVGSNLFRQSESIQRRGLRPARPAWSDGIPKKEDELIHHEEAAIQLDGGFL